jgi:iron complex outermembrane recepter protein
MIGGSFTLLTCSPWYAMGHAMAAEQDAPAALEEIVVSAQRRGDERLLETPVSIGVLSGGDLDAGTSRGVSDVLNQIGGVTLIEGRPGSSNITIRGVVAGVSTSSTTAYYLDELAFSFIDQEQLPDANAYDLQRVEVLRGPQGTLYGANALGGVVRILTNDADLFEYSAKGRVRGSSTSGGGDNYSGDLAFNMPIVAGTLAARGVASYSDLSGFIDSRLNGEQRINDSQLQSYRLKLNYQATDRLSAKLGVTRSRVDSGAPASAFDDYTTPFSDQQFDDRSYDAWNLVVEYVAPSFSVLSATGYLDYSLDTDVEFLRAGTARLRLLNEFDIDIFSQEVRLTSSLDGPWQWSAGAYYKEAKQNQTQTVSNDPQFPLPFEDFNHSQSYALFAELTRSFAEDRFELTGGLRYFKDDLTSTEHSNFFGTPLSAPREAEFDRVTGRMILKYKPGEDLMLYTSVASAFRSGLNQTSAVAGIDPNFPSVKPDSLLTYELGVKGSLLEGRAAFDVAAYFTKWTDVQQVLALPIGFAARVNAGEASGAGVDASLQYQPFASLTLQASVGWNDLGFDQDIFQNGAVLFRRGARLNSSPEYTASLSSAYRFPIGETGLGGVASLAANYSSEKISRLLSGVILNETLSDEIVQSNVRLGIEADRWTAELYAENLFDERGAVAPPNQGAALTSFRLRPRTVGVQVTFDF